LLSKKDLVVDVDKAQKQSANCTVTGGQKSPNNYCKFAAARKMSNKEIEDPLINWVKSKTSAIDFCRGIKNSAEYSMRVSSVI
jgi:hypothetical protein